MSTGRRVSSGCRGGGWASQGRIRKSKQAWSQHTPPGSAQPRGSHLQHPERFPCVGQALLHVERLAGGAGGGEHSGILQRCDQLVPSIRLGQQRLGCLDVVKRAGCEPAHGGGGHRPRDGGKQGPEVGRSTQKSCRPPVPCCAPCPAQCEVALCALRPWTGPGAALTRWRSCAPGCTTSCQTTQPSLRPGAYRCPNLLPAPGPAPRQAACLATPCPGCRLLWRVCVQAHLGGRAREAQHAGRSHRGADMWPCGPWTPGRSAAAPAALPSLIRPRASAPDPPRHAPFVDVCGARQPELRPFSSSCWRGAEDSCRTEGGGGEAGGCSGSRGRC